MHMPRHTSRHQSYDNFQESAISFHPGIWVTTSGHQACVASTFTYFTILPSPLSHSLWKHRQSQDSLQLLAFRVQENWFFFSVLGTQLKALCLVVSSLTPELTQSCVCNPLHYPVEKKGPGAVAHTITQHLGGWSRELWGIWIQLEPHKLKASLP